MQCEVSSVHVRVGTDLHTNEFRHWICVQFNISKVYACNMFFFLHYLFLELRVFADFVDHVCGRDDSPARRDGADHLQCGNYDRVRTHVVEDLISRATIYFDENISEQSYRKK